MYPAQNGVDDRNDDEEHEDCAGGAKVNGHIRAVYDHQPVKVADGDRKNSQNAGYQGSESERASIV